MNINLDGVALDLSFLPEEHHEKAAEAIQSAWKAGTAGLKENRDRALREKKEAQEQARASADGNNAEVAIKLSETQERLTQTENDLRVAQHNADQSQKKLDEANGRADTAESKHNDLVKHTGLTQALGEVGVNNPALLDGSRALLMSQISQGEDGSLMMGDKPLGEALKDWSESDTGKAFVSTGSNAGGAADSGKSEAGQGPNPFKRESFDLSKQAELHSTNPDLAKQLEAEAGVTQFPTPAINSLSQGLGT